MAGTGFATLALDGIEDQPISVEPFNLGGAIQTSIEPFDMLGSLATSTSVEPFDIIGSATKTSVEPFDLGSLAFARSDEPFDILDGTEPVLPPTDLGDGLPEASPALPIYGWWEDTPDVNEDLGTVASD